MALALRITAQAGGAATMQQLRFPHQQRRQLQMFASSCAVLRLHGITNGQNTMQKTLYCTQPTPRSQPERTPDVNKVMYQSNWDSNKPKQSSSKSNLDEKPKSTKDCSKQETNETAKKVSPPSVSSSSDSKSEQMRQNVKGYVFRRYFDYITNYDKVLEKNFPSAVKIYRVFLDGFRDFFGDMKHFLKVNRIANDSPQRLLALNRRELELYMKVPRDMIKVAPALIGCSLPLVGYAFFPLVFMFPRQFLTTHFWTLQQRAEFSQYYMKQRLSYNKPVFRYIQSKLKQLRDHPQHSKLEHVITQLGSGFHPNVEDILAVKDIFIDGPLSLLGMQRKHVRNLLKNHGLGAWLFKRHRLYEHAFLLHYMDLAIMREGGAHNMMRDDLRHACYLRGLNTVNLSNEEQVEWLRNWIKVSTSIKSEHISLFLHLPILLGYNHPNNWQMIYGKK